MSRRVHVFAAVALAGLCAPMIARAGDDAHSARVAPATARFATGCPADPSFFPIGVWLQNPRNAPAFRAMGINTFVALWKGPNEPQLNQIAAAGMYAVTEHTDAALSFANSHVIRGWTQGDEPDNAQRTSLGYGDCVMPAEIMSRYRSLQARDPSRPIFLNFGQGLAHKGWAGRGTTCSKLDHDTYYREASLGARPTDLERDWHHARVRPRASADAGGDPLTGLDVGDLRLARHRLFHA